MRSIQQLTEELWSKSAVAGCGAMKELLAYSEESACVYPYIEQFLEMTYSGNSYFRTRGLLLICANAKWDKAGKIEENIANILKHVTDPKPITTRQFVAMLPQLAADKPALREDILAALRNADTLRYPLSMRGLVDADICSARLMIEKRGI
jgi:hypothetical protein